MGQTEESPAQPGLEIKLLKWAGPKSLWAGLNISRPCTGLVSNIMMTMYSSVLKGEPNVGALK